MGCPDIGCEGWEGMYGLGGVCGSGECVVWVEVGKSFMWCVVWEGEEGVCGDEFGTYRPPKNDTLTRRAVQQAMAGVGGIFWGAYRYHISPVPAGTGSDMNQFRPEPDPT